MRHVHWTFNQTVTSNASRLCWQVSALWWRDVGWNEEDRVGFAKSELSGLGNFRTAAFQQPSPPAFQILGKCLRDAQFQHTNTPAPQGIPAATQHHSNLKIGFGVEISHPASQRLVRFADVIVINDKILDPR